MSEVASEDEKEDIEAEGLRAIDLVSVVKVRYN